MVNIMSAHVAISTQAHEHHRVWEEFVEYVGSSIEQRVRKTQSTYCKIIVTGAYWQFMTEMSDELMRLGYDVAIKRPEGIDSVKHMEMIVSWG